MLQFCGAAVAVAAATIAAAVGVDTATTTIVAAAGVAGTSAGLCVGALPHTRHATAIDAMAAAPSHVDIVMVRGRRQHSAVL